MALAIGLLIGLERGWKSRTEEEGMRAVGVRTLALSGLDVLIVVSQWPKQRISHLETLAKAIRRALDSHVDPQDQMVVNL